MRHAQATVLLGMLGLVALLATALPTAGAAQTCVTACEAAAGTCARRCVEETSESFRTCELACAQSYFVACFRHCVESGEVVFPDPFAEEGEAPEAPDAC